MKVIVKHKLNILQDMNFKVFEVVRILGTKGLEVYVPDLKRTIDLSIDEVMILDLVEEIEKAHIEEDLQKFEFLTEYVKRVCVPENHFLVCSVDVFRYARMN